MSHEAMGDGGCCGWRHSTVREDETWGEAIPFTRRRGRQLCCTTVLLGPSRCSWWRLPRLCAMAAVAGCEVAPLRDENV
ncbi:hypothetical protein AHAS_Ahas11G0036300 [Arachis hypogaea]